MLCLALGSSSSSSIRNMSLDINMDLAILGFEELGQLASTRGIADRTNLSRIELVEALRFQGVGTNPLPCQGTAYFNDIIDELKTTVSNLTTIIVGFMEDIKDRKAQNKEETAVLKNEIATIRREIAACPPVLAETPELYASVVTSNASTPSLQLQADNSRLRGEVARLREQILRTSTTVRTVQHEPSSTSGSMLSYASTAACASIASPVPRATSTVQIHTRPVVPADPVETHSISLPGESGDGWSVVQAKKTRKQHVTANKLRRTITSTYTMPVKAKEPPQSQGTLQGAERVRRSAIYLGNVDVGCTAESIAAWSTNKNVDVLSCSVSDSRFFGTAFAHVVVKASDQEAVLSEAFWPAKIHARLWRFKSDDPNLD